MLKGEAVDAVRVVLTRSIRGQEEPRMFFILVIIMLVVVECALSWMDGCRSYRTWSIGTSVVLYCYNDEKEFFFRVSSVETNTQCQVSRPGPSRHPVESRI